MSKGDIFWGVLGIAAFAAVPLVCLWFVVDGLRNGVVRVKLGAYSRKDDPVWYWACIASYGGLIAWVTYLGARMAFDA